MNNAKKAGTVISKSLLAAALSLAACAGVQADNSWQISPIASETFSEYGNGSLGGQNGGTGWGAAWYNSTYSSTSLSVANTGGLTYPGLAGSGTFGLASASGGRFEDYRELSTTVNSSSSSHGIVYVEILADIANESGNGFSDFRLTSGGNATSYPSTPGLIGSSYQLTGPGTGTTGQGYWTVITSSSSSPTVNSQVDLGTKTLLLDEINYNTGKSSLFVNPDLSTFNYLDPAITPNVTVAGAPSFNGIDILDAHGTISDIQVFAAVPEPATYAVAAGVLLAVQGFRRRRA